MNWNVLMANAVLAVRENGTYVPFSADAWQYAGEMTLLGMGMVFAVLAILWGVLSIFKVVFAGKTPKVKKEAPKAAVAQPSDESKTVVAATVQAVQADDAAMIAVLTAAIAAYRTEEGADGAFRVVSFKRAGAGRAWNGRK